MLSSNMLGIDDPAPSTSNLRTGRPKAYTTRTLPSPKTLRLALAQTLALMSTIAWGLGRSAGRALSDCVDRMVWQLWRFSDLEALVLAFGASSRFS